MKTNSQHVNKLRKNSLIILIFVCIISSFFSILKQNEIFFTKLLSPRLLVVPQFFENNYKPHPNIQKEINNFKGSPLTLITDKFIHHPNINLTKDSMPILPLE